MYIIHKYIYFFIELVTYIVTPLYARGQTVDDIGFLILDIIKLDLVLVAYYATTAIIRLSPRGH